MRILALMLSLFVLVLSPVAQAQGEDDLRAKARQLAAEGGEQYQNERWADALVKLEEAYQILRVPTLGFYSGQCLEKLGRWVEAAARYREVMNLALPERSRELHAKAREDAAAARNKLLPRIPRLRVSLAVDGERKAPLVITIDDTPVFESTLNEPVSLDPGEHVIAASIGEDRVERKVVMEEGNDAEVELELVITPMPVAVLPPPEPPKPPPRPPVDNSGIRLAGYVLLGVSGAIVVGGVITGAVLLSEKSALDDVCSEERCSGAADVGTYNAMRPTTTGLLAVGGVGVALGLVLALAFPDENVETAVRPIVGPGFAGLSARF